jgi:hypothetical protein
MPVLSIVCVSLTALWLALVLAAHLLNPGQSPLSMGMSGLAVGPHGWAMKAAFAARGSAACVLAAALPGALFPGWRLTAGFVLFWVWGVGSVLLALYDTDVPGEPPSRHGRAHVSIALVSYLAALAAVVTLSPALMRSGGSAVTAWWALPIALAAALFLLLQSIAFWQQAREAAARAAAERHVASAASRPREPGVAPPASPLGAYAGLLQRVFVGLIMLWTVLAAVSF